MKLEPKWDVDKQKMVIDCGTDPKIRYSQRIMVIVCETGTKMGCRQAKNGHRLWN